jgi:hypothetical protein
MRPLPSAWPRTIKRPLDRPSRSNSTPRMTMRSIPSSRSHFGTRKFVGGLVGDQADERDGLAGGGTAASRFTMIHFPVDNLAENSKRKFRHADCPKMHRGVMIDAFPYRRIDLRCLGPFGACRMPRQHARSMARASRITCDVAAAPAGPRGNEMLVCERLNEPAGAAHPTGCGFPTRSGCRPADRWAGESGEWPGERVGGRWT